MSCGTPVVCSDRTSLPEVVGDAALTVDPENVQELVTAKWEVSERNHRTRIYRLTAAGKKRLHAEVSKWEHFTRAVAMVLHPKPIEE